jgi:hypothetical protein
LATGLVPVWRDRGDDRFVGGGRRCDWEVEMTQIPGLVEVLGMLANGIGVGAVIAFLFEKMGWFQKLPTDVKWWLVLALCMSLPVASTALLQFVPAETWAVIEPYWHALATGFLIWAGSQAAHKFQLL